MNGKCEKVINLLLQWRMICKNGEWDEWKITMEWKCKNVKCKKIMLELLGIMKNASYVWLRLNKWIKYVKLWIKCKKRQKNYQVLIKNEKYE